MTKKKSLKSRISAWTNAFRKKSEATTFQYMDIEAPSNEGIEVFSPQYSHVVVRSSKSIKFCAASLCLESRELLLISDDNGNNSCAYFNEIDIFSFISLVSSPEICIEELGDLGFRKLPVSLYSNKAQARVKKDVGENSTLVMIAIAESTVCVDVPKLGFMDVRCRPICEKVLMGGDSDIKYHTPERLNSLRWQNCELSPIFLAILASKAGNSALEQCQKTSSEWTGVAEHLNELDREISDYFGQGGGRGYFETAAAREISEDPEIVQMMEELTKHTRRGVN